MEKQELDVFSSYAFQMSDMLSLIFPRKPFLCREGGKSVQNLIELSTVSLTERSKSIK